MNRSASLTGRVDFAAVYFPRFALQAVLRHEPEAATECLALLDGTTGTPKVMQATSSATREGVTLGLTAPQALARCAGLKIRHRSSEREVSTTDAMLQCAYEFSPNLETTAPGLLTLDLRGLSCLRGSADAPVERQRLQHWADGLLSGLAALNLRCVIGMGPTPSVAQLASKWVEQVKGPARWTSALVVVENPADFIRSLGIEALNPSDHVMALFRRWGLGTVGEMLDLGQAEVADRLGLEALALFGAASAGGARPLRLVTPSERFEEGHDFEQPVETHEPLLFFLRRFVDALCRRLESAGWAAGSLKLSLRFDSGATSVKELRVPQPTCRPDILFRMLQTYLETFRSESPLKGLVLRVEPARPEQKQFSLFETAIRDPHQFQETLARLTGMLGADRVGSPLRENSHRTDAFHMVPPDFEAPPRSEPLELTGLRQPVPMRRLRPAVPAEVQTSKDLSNATRPVGLRCSIARGALRIAVGPWKSSGGWWEGEGWEREEWDVSLASGTVLRLVQVGSEWRVEAVLD
ncbi:MAG: DNA polymerase Y family protein [Verrucomicrobiales bacterium]|nr:DNA polymerase Y family protein [Verrucomicrobiales bacterium]